MSRFWAAGGSSSESESDDDSSYSSSGSSAGPRANENKWADLSDDSGESEMDYVVGCCMNAMGMHVSHTLFSLITITLPLFTIDSEDEVRVVKSAKERSLETFRLHIKNIKSAMKTRDFLTIQSEFDALSKAMIKAKKILAQGIPRPLVKLLCDLEDYITAQLADKAAFKTLSASQGRALNRMKLTLKKHNKPFALVMKEYRKNPMSSEEESSSEEENEVSSNEEESSSSEEDSSDDDDSDDDSSDEDDSVSSTTRISLRHWDDNSHFRSTDLLNSSFPTAIHV